MKKLVLALGLTCFILFGALSVQNIYGVTTSVEMVKFDKDPKKTDDKKAADNKDAKATSTDSKSCESKCTSSSSCSKSSSSCCKPGDASSKGDCSKPCPDKK